MTLWDNRILRDEAGGELWYKVPRLEPDGSRDSNRTNLCNSLRIAKAHELPMIGFLKDHVERPGKRQKCSTNHVFTITDVIEVEADDAFYLRLLPHTPDDLGCFPTIQRLVREGWRADQMVALNRHLAVQVDLASQDRSARLMRLRSADRLPRQINVTTTVFVRNPDVVAEVLELARGKCGYCRKNAPFRRKKGGTPYLEVHHRVPLALGGEDTVENAIAACPNCHRRQHHG